MQTLRLLFLALIAPTLAVAAEPPPVPTGYQLSLLQPGELQAYVGGIYEGQLLMAEIAGVSPVVCVDPMLTRAEVTLRILQALPELPHKVMALPARVVVLTVLMRQHGCPAGQQRVAPRSRRGE